MELAWRLRLWMRSLAYYMHGTQWSIPKWWPSSWLAVRHMRPSHRSERLAVEGETSGEGKAVWVFTAARYHGLIRAWMLCNLSYVTNIVFLCFQFLPEQSNWLRRCCTTFPNVAVAMRRRPSMVSLYFLLVVKTRVIPGHWNYCHLAGSVTTTTDEFIFGASKRSWRTRNRSAYAPSSRMPIATSRRSSRFSWSLKI